MAIPGLPVEHHISPATGAADTVAIPVVGVLAASTILAVIGHSEATGLYEGFAVDDATAGAGTVTFATVDTTGYKLIVIYSNQPQP
jgi:hypothetical protein